MNDPYLPAPRFLVDDQPAAEIPAPSQTASVCQKRSVIRTRLL